MPHPYGGKTCGTKVDGQKQTLERSLSYYERGYQEGPVNDCGYTGLNAAYVLDLLASLEETQAIETGNTSEIARECQSLAKIIRDDYIEIIRRNSEQFLAGVQRNIRTRVAAEFTTNLKMIFLPNYSRTERVGELYEEELYARIDDGEGGQHRWLNDLYIQPKGEDQSFAPKHDNWRRSSKVPILILNATTLNTGHNWQFTGSWMGEPPVAINTQVDGNYRLRCRYYEDAPSYYQRNGF